MSRLATDRPTDEELARLVAAGQAEVFAQLYERYYARAHRLAWAMTGRREAAEELTQEIFLRAWQKAGQFRGEASFGTWFYRLAAHCCLNFRKRLPARAHESLDAVEQTPQPDAMKQIEANVRRQEIQGEVQRALLSLKPKWRLIVFLFAAALADNWPQWRGPFLNGVSDEKNLPLRWSREENIAWKLSLPGPSAATPVICGDNVFLNVTQGKEIYLWRLEKKQGRLLWKKSLGGNATELRTHPKHNPSTPSPVTDGKSVYALNAYGSLVSFDLAGNEIWKRELWQDYGRFVLRFGFSSSPLLYEDSLYLQVLRETPPGEPSYLLRIDKKTGKTIWKKDFSAAPGFKAAEAYSTPTILKHGKSAELVVNGSDQTEKCETEK